MSAQLLDVCALEKNCANLCDRSKRSRFIFRFYNIENETVEDFTGHGINDLQLGILRTPIDPVRTLRDDPLRALRAIRFMQVSNF